MASNTITLSSDSTLAEYVPLEQFKGILEQRISIPPDYVAILMRDGQIVEALQGAHIAMGGIWRKVKDLIGGKHALRLLVADLKPFKIDGYAEGITRDQVPIVAEPSFELQVNPDKPANILGMMQEHAGLDKQDVYARILPHLNDRVFSATLKSVDAAELRGNTALQDKLQSEVMREVERIAGDLGLLVRAVSVNWPLNEEEQAAMARRAETRAQEMADFRFERLKHDMEREKEGTLLRLQTDLDIEKIRSASEDELRRMVLDQELDFVDAREAGMRLQEMKALQHELEIQKTEQLAAFERALGKAGNEVELTRITLARRKLELEIRDLEERQELALAKIRQMQEIEIAAAAREEQVKALRELDAVDLDKQDRGVDIDNKRADSAHRRAMETQRLEMDERLRMLELQGKLDPDQLLAIAAQQAPDVARVFEERARAAHANDDEKRALYERMIDELKEGRIASDEQARYFIHETMQSIASTRPAAPPPPPPPPDTQSETRPCPACNRPVPVTASVCKYCQSSLGG